jgi:hypothetical protein
MYFAAHHSQQTYIDTYGVGYSVQKGMHRHTQGCQLPGTLVHFSRAVRMISTDTMGVDVGGMKQGEQG